MEFPIRELQPVDFPRLLREIPDPPEQIFIRGALPTEDSKILAVVGSRNYTDYGKAVTETLIDGLRGHNITIVSGLALGIDGLAHRAALDTGLHTLAVPGSGIDDSVLYPRRHRALAAEILTSGGGLLSEYAPTFRATPWSFPRRNRIMAGIAHATLVVEASLQSGTLITSRLATEYNRDVFTVPGNIFSQNTAGPHMLIKLGATPITAPEDILEALGIEASAPQGALHPAGRSPEEENVLSLLHEPRERDALIRALGVDASRANILLMQMEIDGLIHIDGGVVRRSI